MPPQPTKPIPKRKPPTFKPPRPASKPTKPTKTKPSIPRRKSAPSKRTTHLHSNSPTPTPSPSPSPSSDDIFSDSQQPPTNECNPSPSTEDPPPTIPPALLTRLLQHHFQDKKTTTRLGKEANGVAGKYMETFVREAIARAAFERREAMAREGGKGRVGGEFLDVEDLEKLAPQLLLDF